MCFFTHLTLMCCQVTSSNIGSNKHSTPELCSLKSMLVVHPCTCNARSSWFYIFNVLQTSSCALRQELTACPRAVKGSADVCIALPTGQRVSSCLTSLATYAGALCILRLTAGQDWQYGGMYGTHKGLGSGRRGEGLRLGELAAWNPKR